MKLFWYKFNNTFYKPNHFINLSNICCIAMKRSSLQKELSKVMPKKFYKIDPRSLQWSGAWFTQIRFGLICRC